MTSKLHAVLFGTDEMLTLTRRWILERAGFVVLTARRASEAELLLKQHPVRLLVLCYDTEQECPQILKAVEAAGTAGIAKLWVGRPGSKLPDFLPQDIPATAGDPNELYLAALRAFRAFDGTEERY